MRYIIILLLFSPLISLSQTSDSVTLNDTTFIYNKETNETQILLFVEQMPEPLYNVNEYLSNNIVYPAKARKQRISGRVLVKFVVDTTGEITTVEVPKSIHPLLDAEAIRVVSRMPKWKPGMHKGKHVRVYFTLPINFRLNNGN